MRAIAKQSGASFEFEQGLVGGGAIDADGQPLPPETLKLCQGAHAILFGAVGGPKWDGLPQESKPERGLLGMRKELDLYANLRPATCFPMLVDASPLKRSVVEGTDIMVIRELTGGPLLRRAAGRRALRRRLGAGRQHHGLHLARDRAGGPHGVRGRAQAPQAADLGGQGQRPGRVAALARGRHTCGQGLSRRDARSRARRQLRHGPRPPADPVRHDRHREHLRRHPVRRGGDPGRVHGHAALGLARRPGGPLRAGARHRARYRRAGDRQPHRGHFVGGDADAVLSKHGSRGRSDRRRGEPGARAGAPHAGHRRAPAARRSARARWGT